MNKIVLLAFASLFAVGCTLTPAPASNTKILGTLDLKFGSQENPIFSSVKNNTRSLGYPSFTDSDFTAVASSFVTRDEGTVRTLTATYTLTNNTLDPFQNLSLVAYNKPGNANGSAINSINAFNGAPSSTDVYNVRPAQGTNGSVAVSEFKSDLQLYTKSEIESFWVFALQEGLPGNPLEYGYVVRQNSATHARSIAPGGTGVVSISVKIPVSADVSSGARFTMTFLVADNGSDHVVQSLEEPVDGVAAAARASSVGAGTEVRVFGNSTSSATPRLTMSSVKLAGDIGSNLSNLSSMTGLVHDEQLAINAPIPDGTGFFPPIYGLPTIRTFSVPTIAGTVAKVTLRAKINHLDLSTVRIRLTSPSGTTIVLFEDILNYGAGSNINATFDDTSGSALDPNCYQQSTCVGTFKPKNPLSGFNNSVVTGNWVVQVDDGYRFDTGTLDELVLDITVK